MHEQKAHDLLRKHNISLTDVKERRTSLHHLRQIVHAEELPFDVFKALVKLRHYDWSAEGGARSAKPPENFLLRSALCAPPSI